MSPPEMLVGNQSEGEGFTRWKAFPGCSTVFTDDDTTVAECEGATTGQACDIARLCSAAPELLAVCEMIVRASMSESRPSRGESSIGWQKGDGFTASDVRAAARSALNKALGK